MPQNKQQIWLILRTTVTSSTQSSRLMMRSADTDIHTHTHAAARTILTVSIPSFDVVGWCKWGLWSYVRLLHKARRVESWIKREGELLHHYKGDSHCTKSSSYFTWMNHNTWAFSSNMSLPWNTETISFRYSGYAEKPAQLPQPHASAASLCHHCARPSPFSLFQRPAVDGDTAVRLSCQQSIKCIDNL